MYVPWHVPSKILIWMLTVIGMVSFLSLFCASVTSRVCIARITNILFVHASFHLLEHVSPANIPAKDVVYHTLGAISKKITDAHAKGVADVMALLQAAPLKKIAENILKDTKVIHALKSGDILWKAQLTSANSRWKEEYI
jgi:hypothetical protein